MKQFSVYRPNRQQQKPDRRRREGTQERRQRRQMSFVWRLLAGEKWVPSSSKSVLVLGGPPAYINNSNCVPADPDEWLAKREAFWGFDKQRLPRQPAAQQADEYGDSVLPMTPTYCTPVPTNCPTRRPGSSFAQRGMRVERIIKDEWTVWCSVCGSAAAALLALGPSTDWGLSGLETSVMTLVSPVCLYHW